MMRTILEHQWAGRGVRWTLKRATATAHGRVDARFGGLDLRRREGYAAFLCASAAVLAPLEALLEKEGVGEVLGDWSRRRRRKGLQADLDALGLRTTPLDLPRRRLDEAELLGAAYVLEGSRLGARVLLERVQASDDPAVRGNARYLSHGDGERLWASFLERLEKGATAGLDARRMIESALFTFALFERSAETAAASEAVNHA